VEVGIRGNKGSLSTLVRDRVCGMEGGLCASRGLDVNDRFVLNPRNFLLYINDDHAF
jgi:hypothetical protein